MEKKTKKVRKKKFSFKKFLLLSLFLYLIINLFCYTINLKIKNIYITGNNLVSDNEIIEKAKIKNYPSILKANSLLLKKRILKIDLIENVNIEKNIFGKLTIRVKEYKPLYKRQDNIILNNGKTTNKKIIGIPTLTSDLDKTIEKKFIKSFSKVNLNSIKLISEIEYCPSLSNDVKIDNERFLAYMNDGNRVYFNLLNIENLNLYPKINSSLDNEKGFIYLDSSNSENFIFTPF